MTDRIDELLDAPDDDVAAECAKLLDTLRGRLGPFSVTAFLKPFFTEAPAVVYEVRAMWTEKGEEMGLAMNDARLHQMGRCTLLLLRQVDDETKRLELS